MKSFVINVLITTDRWHDGMWSIGSRSKWTGINTMGIWLIWANKPARIMDWLIIRAVFKWASQKQNLSNASDQSWHEETFKWTNYILKVMRAASDSPAGKRVWASHVICLGFYPDWLRKRHEILQRIIKHSNSNTKQSQNNPLVTSEKHFPKLCSVQEYKQHYGCCRQ